MDWVMSLTELIISAIIILGTCSFLYVLRLSIDYYCELLKEGNSSMKQEDVEELCVRIRSGINKKTCTLLFCILCIVVIFASFIAYFKVSSVYMDAIIITSGVALALFIIITGFILREIFCLLEKLIYKRKLLSSEDKTILIIAVTIFCAITSLGYSVEFALMMFSIIIGRFIWIDSEEGGAVKQAKEIYYSASQEVSFIGFKFLIPMIGANVLYMLSGKLELTLIFMAGVIGIINIKDVFNNIYGIVGLPSKSKDF